MRAAALQPSPARLASLRHDAAAACHPAQKEAKSDISTPHKQAGMHAAAPIHIGGDIRVCVCTKMKPKIFKYVKLCI